VKSYRDRSLVLTELSEAIHRGLDDERLIADARHTYACTHGPRATTAPRAQRGQLSYTDSQLRMSTGPDGRLLSWHIPRFRGLRWVGINREPHRTVVESAGLGLFC
jgi:hypothetical protein